MRPSSSDYKYSGIRSIDLVEIKHIHIDPSEEEDEEKKKVVMARLGAAVALLVLVSLVASATSTTVPGCCLDFHSWGEEVENTGCSPEMSDACNAWCQSSCRGGECKQRSHGWHFCHCYC